MRQAKIAARRGREVCGLLVAASDVVEFVPIRNTLRRRGGYAFDSKQTDRVQQAINVLGHRIVGTYHSHPFSGPEPSSTDLAHAFEGDVMLILDATASETKALLIGKRAARPISLLEV